jgi:hypothetical protein
MLAVNVAGSTYEQEQIMVGMKGRERYTLVGNAVSNSTEECS